MPEQETCPNTPVSTGNNLHKVTVQCTAAPQHSTSSWSLKLLDKYKQSNWKVSYATTKTASVMSQWWVHGMLQHLPVFSSPASPHGVHTTIGILWDLIIFFITAGNLIIIVCHVWRSTNHTQLITQFFSLSVDIIFNYQITNLLTTQAGYSHVVVNIHIVRALYRTEGRHEPLLVSDTKGKLNVPILVIEHKGPELIPDSRQSACRWEHA